MSNYAEIARKNWQRLAPKALEQMGQQMDLDLYFQDLENQAWQMVMDLEDQYLAQQEQTDSYLQNVGMRQAARKMAEEYVIKELLTPPQESWEPEEEQMDTWQIQSELLWIRQTMRQFQIHLNLTPELQADLTPVEIQDNQQEYDRLMAPHIKRKQELEQMLAAA